MSETQNYDDRIKLPQRFDVKKLQEEARNICQGSFIQYDVVPLRSPAFTVDSSQPVPPPAEDYADGSWTPWLDTPALESSDYLTEVINTFRRHCTITLVRLRRLHGWRRPWLLTWSRGVIQFVRRRRSAMRSPQERSRRRASAYPESHEQSGAGGR